MTITVNVPAEVYDALAEMAGREDVSVERIAGAALGEQVVQWTRLRDLARRPVTREEFIAALDQAPDIEPAPEDRI